MPVFPIQWGGVTSSVGEVTGSSIGTTITASGSTNTKGSYSQLIASTAGLSSWLILEVCTNVNGSTMLLDLAIGAGGSEKIIVGDLMVQGSRALFAMPLPVLIPAGVRLSARAQAATASHTCFVKVTLIGPSRGMQATPGVVTCYGQNTGTSRGVSIDSGGSANTKGSWTQIVASTSAAARGFYLALGGQGNTSTTQCSWLFDVAIGAGGSEKTILSNWFVDMKGSGAYQPLPNMSPFIPIAIPSGERLSVRSQCSITDATDRLLDAQIITVSQ